MARKTSTKIKLKGSSKLHKAHSHIRTAKPRAPRKEVQELLGIHDQDKAPEAAQTITFAVDTAELSKLVDEAVERLKAEIHPQVVEELPYAHTNKVQVEPSPLEKVEVELTDALLVTDNLVQALQDRLVRVTREAGEGLEGCMSERTGIPIVDGFYIRLGAVRKVNIDLQDLLDRLAV